MNSRKFRKILCIILAALMLISLLAMVIPVRAYAVSQADIDAVKAEKDALTAQKKTFQAKIDELEAQQADVLEQKKALDERNEITLEQIELNKQEVALYNQMIEEKKKDVEAAKAIEDEQLERLRARVRTMEENGNYDYLAIILQCSSFEELLTAIDDIGEIMESDKRLEDAYIQARENHEAIQAEYEAYKAELEAKIAALEEEQRQLEAEIEEARALITKLEEDIENTREQYEAILAQEQAKANELSNLAAQLAAEEEAARQAAQNQGEAYNATVGTGQWYWPINSTLITSRYGSRMHPILGYERFHAGVDINANSGAPIYAADDGTVARATFDNSYGNYVMITHGNGYTTVYAHCSGLAVSAGQTVSRGQVIGYAGETGLASGVHLHFEVRYNGSTMDPISLYPGVALSYYNC